MYVCGNMYNKIYTYYYIYPLNPKPARRVAAPSPSSSSLVTEIATRLSKVNLPPCN